MKNALTRRTAMHHAAWGAAAWWIPSQVHAAVAADDRLDVAVIGIGMRGKYLIANLPESIRVTALCDCSLDQIETARKPKDRFETLLASFAGGDGATAAIYQDYRVMLDRQRFDAVIIATPDHHHASAAILAMQAGCHVYVEKPLAVTVAEGRAIVEAARKYDRVVQVGSQQRTMAVNRRACEFIRDGGLGRISRVEEKNFPGPLSYDPQMFPREAIPERFDWDLFCGPTPKRPYNRHLWIKDAFDVGYLTWRGWDLFRDYSGHLMTNWGAHSVDMIQFALGKDSTGPSEIKLHPEQLDEFIDDQWHQKTPPLGTLGDRTADQMRYCPLTMVYADETVVEFKPSVRRTKFYGEKGTLTLSRNDYQTDPVNLLPPPTQREKGAWAGDGHVARPHLENWVEAIRSRAVPNAPIEVGHRSITVCHLANLARQVGHDLKWDPVTERFRDDDHNALLSRPRRAGFELPKV